MLLRQTEFAALQSLRRRGAQTNNDPGSDQSDFSVQPGTAGRDFIRARLLVNAQWQALQPAASLRNSARVASRGICGTALTECLCLSASP